MPPRRTSHHQVTRKAATHAAEDAGPANGDPKAIATTPTAQAITRLELAITRVAESLNRWVGEMHANISDVSLSPGDLFILHSIRLRSNSRNVGELSRFLNRTDIANVQYSLRKLTAAKLIVRERGASGRESGYRLTGKGLTVTEEFAKVRERLLLRLVDEIPGIQSEVNAAARLLERIGALYDLSTQFILDEGVIGLEE